MSITGENLLKFQHMEAKQDAAEYPTIHRRNKKGNQNMHSVQFSSVTQSCLTFCDLMNHSTPSLPVHHYILEFNQTHIHWVNDAIQPSHLLSPPSPPALNLSYHQCLSQWAHSLHQFFSHEYGLIFFRIDCFDLLTVQGTLKSLLKHRSSKVSILWHSAFFMVKLSHPYMTTGTP